MEQRQSEKAKRECRDFWKYIDAKPGDNLELSVAHLQLLKNQESDLFEQHASANAMYMRLLEEETLILSRTNRTLIFKGKNYFVSERQLNIIEVLLERIFQSREINPFENPYLNWVPSTIMLKYDEIRSLCFPDEQVPQKMSNIFKSAPELWNTLIKSPKRGYYALNIPYWHPTKSFNE